MYTIYRLIDPRNNQPFYIGCTVNPLQRLSGHRWCHHAKHSPPKVKERVTELRNLGLSPILAVIEETTDKTRESYWIEHLERLGVGLLNIRAGIGGLRAKKIT